MHDYDSHALTPGLTFTRAAIATALSPTYTSATHQYAAKRWGSESRVADFLRKAAISDSNPDRSFDSSISEFIELVRPRTILGRLDGLRRVPVATPFVAQSDGAVAYWTAEGAATPVSRQAFDRETMDALKIAALCVFDKRLLESADPRAESMIRGDLVRAVAELSDRTFIDPTNGGTPGVMPASVTNGATTFASVGSISEDISGLIEAFQGDFATAAFIAHPRLATQIGLLAGGRGVAADLGAKGGSLCGLPVIVSASCQLTSDGGTITLLDASGICYVDEGAELSTSQSGTVEMDTSPTGVTTTPAAATSSLVSLFQTDSIGLIVSRSLNWRAARSGAVVCVTGCHYEAA